MLKQMAALFVAVLVCGSAAASPYGQRGFDRTISRVVSMPGDGNLQRRTHRYGLNVLNVMWEDTGRAGGSSVGPNISDLTLQVRQKLQGGGMKTHMLPVIRHPNFTDKTGDIRADKLWVRVGNHDKSGQGHAVPLSEVLGNMRKYLSDPTSLRGSDDFTARRDTHYLVSAQHVFVPLPKGGKAEFNPVIFNYQSSPSSPAVLTLLVTRHGTSATILENRPGDQSLQGWGQQLYFNNKGQKTVFTAERRSDVARRIEVGETSAQDKGALEEGADMMMLVQVPLRHKNRGYMYGLGGGGPMDGEGMVPMMESAPSKGASSSSRARRSDVERAVIGYGEDLGPYYEMGGLALERDDRFPVRVTVQFYRGTSNGVVSNQDLADVNEMISKVYDDADYVGSLVVPNGPRHRPTDWIKDRPLHSWNPWRRTTVMSKY